MGDTIVGVSTCDDKDAGLDDDALLLTLVGLLFLRPNQEKIPDFFPELLFSSFFPSEA